MDTNLPWWVGALPTVIVLFAGYQAYDSQRSLFRFQDAQMMAAQLEVYGAQSSDRFASLNDKVADLAGISKSFTGSLDRSKMSFAPDDVNGAHGAGYMVTVRGIGKADCESLEPNILFESVTVNGQTIRRGSMSVDQIRDLCHSTFWPWASENVVILRGS
jgi:hypothetical protein